MEALMKNRFTALVRREFIDHRNSFLIVPGILGALLLVFVVIALVGVGQLPFDVITDGQFDSLEALIDHETTRAAADGADVREGLDHAIAAVYWVLSQFVLVALPFVIFFSLLGSLYEERRDKSILFWKSMPVSDWQEVGAKLFASLVVAPFIAFAVMLGAMFAIAILLSIYALLLGVPVSLLWPVGTMISVWFAWLAYYMANILWLLPLCTWVLLVSAGAPRMPFVFAALPVAAIGIAEGIFYYTTDFLEWIGSRFTAISLRVAEQVGTHEPENIKDAIEFANLQMSGTTVFNAISDSLSDPQFWLGIVIAGVFMWGAVELRKRANT